MPQYSQEQLRKLFVKLPDELKDAILSEDTADTIREICQRNEIKERDIPRLARLVGDALMGLLPPEDFQGALESDLNIERDKAEKASREVNRFILFPVKDSLKEFYKEISFAPGGRIIAPEAKGNPETLKPVSRSQKERRKPKSDVYREPVE